MKAVIWGMIFLTMFSALIMLSCIRISGMCSEQEEQRKKEKE